MKQWILQTLDFNPSDPKSSKRILPFNQVQDARSRKRRQIESGALSTYFGRV